jgi:hypothetical protein
MHHERVAITARQKSVSSCLNRMRIATVIFTALLASATLMAQERQPSPSNDGSPAVASPAEASPLNLPVSLDRIKAQLARPPAKQLRGLDQQPQFRVEVQEQRKLDDLIASLDFKAGPVPAGGITAAEMQRIMFSPVDNPLRQPYAAFSQPELLTILIENLAGRYLAGRALDSLTAAERAHAEAAAKAEVRQAIRDYCVQQPNHGASITICSSRLP